MNLQTLLAVIPERVARTASGTPFAASPELAAGGSRIAYLSQLLHWLTPCSELTAEGQRTLGLAPAGRDKPLDRDEDEQLESEEA